MFDVFYFWKQKRTLSINISRGKPPSISGLKPTLEVFVLHLKTNDIMDHKTFLFLGVEGAAANAEIKTLTEQNSRLKEAIVR